jgi:drug/metabolite transporter (DMT)-like permease
MTTRLRKLPVVRSRSNVEIGVYGAMLANLVIAAALTVSAPHTWQSPSQPLLEAFAGIGGAVFLAYTVVVTDLVRRVRRDGESETLLGVVTGLGICGILGVGLTLLLIDASEPLGGLDHLALFWAFSSLTLLAGLVAGSPLIAYEDARSRHLNPDE